MAWWLDERRGTGECPRTRHGRRAGDGQHGARQPLFAAGQPHTGIEAGGLGGLGLDAQRLLGTLGFARGLLEDL